MTKLDPKGLEAAARKLCRLDGYNPDDPKKYGSGANAWEAYYKEAEAAIAAYLSTAEPLQRAIAAQPASPGREG